MKELLYGTYRVVVAVAVVVVAVAVRDTMCRDGAGGERRRGGGGGLAMHVCSGVSGVLPVHDVALSRMLCFCAVCTYEDVAVVCYVADVCAPSPRVARSSRAPTQCGVIARLSCGCCGTIMRTCMGARDCVCYRASPRVCAWRVHNVVGGSTTAFIVCCEAGRREGGCMCGARRCYARRYARRGALEQWRARVF